MSRSAASGFYTRRRGAAGEPTLQSKSRPAGGSAEVFRVKRAAHLLVGAQPADPCRLLWLEDGVPFGVDPTRVLRWNMAA
jgi:hypothetical protein